MSFIVVVLVHDSIVSVEEPSFNCTTRFLNLFLVIHSLVTEFHSIIWVYVASLVSSHPRTTCRFISREVSWVIERFAKLLLVSLIVIGAGNEMFVNSHIFFS